MKKIMVALIAGAMGVAAQAASVSWTANYIRLPEADLGWRAADQLPYSGYMAYLIDTIDPLNGFTDTITAANYRDAINKATKSTTLVRAGTSSPYGKLSTTQKFECDYGVGQGAYVMIIIDSQESNFVVSGQVPVTEGSQNNRVFFDFRDITPQDPETGMGMGWTSTAVPEPSSAMLLILGLAGLALKRRRT